VEKFLIGQSFSRELERKRHEDEARDGNEEASLQTVGKN